MKTNLKDYVFHKRNFLSKEVCEETLSEMKKIQFQEHVFHNPLTGEYKSRSGSKELSMSWDNVSTKMFITKQMKPALIEYQDVHLKKCGCDKTFKGWQGYTNIRFNKYEEDKLMAFHDDHIHSMFDGERKGIPILSVLGTLNDDFEGGEFILFEDYKINFKQGDLLIFPSIFLYPHRVEPVTKGNRYSYISWVW